MISGLKRLKLRWDINNNHIIYDINKKRYLVFNPGETKYTEYYPRKGQQKRIFVHMTNVLEVDMDTLEYSFIGRWHKFDIYQRLNDGFYRELTKSEGARFLIKAESCS